MHDEELKKKLESWLGPSLVLGNIEVTGKCEPGDNYLSDAFSLKLTGYIGEKKKQCEKHVFVKRLSKNCIMHEAFCKQAFSNEAIFYNMFIPNVTNQPCVPYCYGADNSVILMEDLRRKGFVSPQRKTMLTEDHVRLILKELAKLHSGSYYLRTHKKELYNEISKKLKSSLPDGLKFINNSIITCLKVLKEEEHLYSDTIKLLEDLVNDEGKLLQLLSVFVEDDNDPLNVMIHGDCWLKNCMFKYDDDGFPVGASLVDFQILNRASLVADLITLFYVNTKPGSLNHVKLLKYYHITLSDLLQAQGIEPPHFYQIVQKFEASLINGVLISLVYLPVMCVDTVINETTDYDWVTNSLYKERVKLIVDYFVLKNNKNL